MGLHTPDKGIREFVNMNGEEIKEEIKEDFEEQLCLDSKRSTKKGIGSLGSGKKTPSAFSGYNKSERKTSTTGYNSHNNDGVNVMNLSDINVMNESKVSLYQTDFMRFGFK